MYRNPKSSTGSGDELPEQTLDAGETIADGLGRDRGGDILLGQHFLASLNSVRAMRLRARPRHFAVAIGLPGGVAPLR